MKMSIRTTKMQKIRRRVRDSIRVAKRRGYSIVTNDTLDQVNACCCPLAAVFVANNRLTPGTPLDETVNPLTEARRALRLKESDIGNFISGFDSGEVHSWDRNSQYRNFGVELRDELDTGKL